MALRRLCVGFGGLGLDRWNRARVSGQWTLSGFVKKSEQEGDGGPYTRLMVSFGNWDSFLPALHRFRDHREVPLGWHHEQALAAAPRLPYCPNGAFFFGVSGLVQVLA